MRTLKLADVDATSLISQISPGTFQTDAVIQPRDWCLHLQGYHPK